MRMQLTEAFEFVLRTWNYLSWPEYIKNCNKFRAPFAVKFNYFYKYFQAQTSWKHRKENDSNEAKYLDS